MKKLTFKSPTPEIEGRYSKNLGSYEAVSHAWVYSHQTGKTEGKNQSVFFDDADAIYSYGYHYCIARKVYDKDGVLEFILINGAYASNTTSRHIGAVLGAIPPNIRVIHNMNLGSHSPTKESIADDVKTKLSRVIQSMDEYPRKRTDATRNEVLNAATQIKEDAELLVSVFGLKKYLNTKDKTVLSSPITDLDIDEIRAKAERQRKAAAKRALIRQQKNEAEKWERYNTRLVMWLTNEVLDAHPPYGADIRLRVNGDDIETTERVKVPIKKCRVLYTLVNEGRAVGHKLDDLYHVSRSNGTLVIGCHEIDRKEVERIAEQLGWTT